MSLSLQAHCAHAVAVDYREVDPLFRSVHVQELHHFLVPDVAQYDRPENSTALIAVPGAQGIPLCPECPWHPALQVRSLNTNCVITDADSYDARIFFDPQANVFRLLSPKLVFY